MMTVTQEEIAGYTVAFGETRDCQGRRLTETRYGNYTDIIREVWDTLFPHQQFDNELTSIDRAILKAAFFAIFSDGHCFLPVTVWKTMVKEVIALRGGRVRMRREEPLFLALLDRDNRPTISGHQLRAVVFARFERGLTDVTPVSHPAITRVLW